MNLKDLLKKTPNHQTLTKITEDQLRNSHELRVTLRDYKEYFFFTWRNMPFEMKKTYSKDEAGQNQKDIDNY